MKIALRCVASCLAGLLLLFAWHASRPAWKHPQMGGNAASRPAFEAAREVRVLGVLTWNLGKAGLYAGGVGANGAAEVELRLAGMAQVLRSSAADVVALQEVVMEAGPWHVDQVQRLADLAGYAHWAASENYCFGLPGLCLRSGNALLSRFPLRALEVQELAGAKPFWDPTGRRRALWCELELGAETLWLASLRLDSFDLANNAVQVDEILTRLDGRPALLAGDFNAEPASAPLHRWADARSWSGNLSGPATFPSHAPTRRIDYVLAPASWSLLEEHVLQSSLSDHLPLLARFELP